MKDNGDMKQKIAQRWAYGARGRQLWRRNNWEGSGGTIHGVVMMVSAAVADVCDDSVGGDGWWVDDG